jgi:hypothetical protein
MALAIFIKKRDASKKPNHGVMELYAIQKKIQIGGNNEKTGFIRFDYFLRREFVRDRRQRWRQLQVIS